jgi:hypothetical protein
METPMPTTERALPRHTLRIALALLFTLGSLGAGRPAAASPVNVASVAEADGAADLADAAENGGVSEGSYGYFRIVEGGATLVQAGNGTRSAAAVNQPVMPGDRVLVADRGRVEIVLSDRNLLRLDGGSEVVLLKLAGTPDTHDRSTQIRLAEGNFQLVVVQDSLGDTLPRVDTPNATVYIQYPGSYRITSDQGSFSAVVARRGSAEVVTGRGSVRVRAGEEAQVEGAENARAEVAQASGFDAVERWGRDLETQVAGTGGSSDYLDERLSYEGAPLRRYGSWIEVNNQHYWRPTVDGGWRPFTDGYWTPTPSGLTWVATEPWGWVPYHYGSWDYLDGYGWIWAPGYVYSPAWVYWYWGPSQIGWCPVGYYTRWYGHRYHDPAFRHGVYGWAGGDWNLFANWSFVDTGHFGHRDLGHWVRHGGDFDGRGGHGDQGGRHGHGEGRGQAAGDLRGDMQMRELPRGIITTDTRGITAGRWNHPDQVQNLLRNRGGRNGLNGGGNLPDVTSFVARKPNLPPQVLRVVTADTPDRGRFSGTPLRPVTLGTSPPAGSPLDNRGHWADRIPVQTGRDGSPASPRGTGGRQETIHRGGRLDERQPAATPTVAAPHGTGGERWRERPAARNVEPGVEPRGRAGERPYQASPPPSTDRPRSNGWREVPTQGPRNEVPDRGQRPEAAPRYTPPPQRYAPPPERYSPPPTRYNPPSAPPYNPPPQRPAERPAQREQPAQRPPEHQRPPERSEQRHERPAQRPPGS